MKIAVLNEFSQAPKNNIIVNELKKVVEPMGHEVYNAAMEVPLSTEDVPESIHRRKSPFSFAFRNPGSSAFEFRSS